VIAFLLAQYTKEVIMFEEENLFVSGDKSMTNFIFHLVSVATIISYFSYNILYQSDEHFDNLPWKYLLKTLSLTSGISIMLSLTISIFSNNFLFGFILSIYGFISWISVWVFSALIIIVWETVPRLSKIIQSSVYWNK
jgi:hypothetical protein